MNEFIELVPKKKLPVDIPAKKHAPTKKKPPKPKKPKMKKGGWKETLWKKLKKFKHSKFVNHFHFIKATNFMIDHNNGKTLIFHDAPTKRDLSKWTEKFPDAWVLINTYTDMFIRIKLSSYLKLLEITNVVMREKCEVQTDCEDDVLEQYYRETVIDNINDLLHWVNYHRTELDITSNEDEDSGYMSRHVFDVRMLVTKLDGTTETYRTDNAFMKAYGLLLF